MHPTTEHATSRSPYQHGLDRNPANHLPLTPLGFLDRSAQVHPEGIAVVHAGTTQTWRQTRESWRVSASKICVCACLRDWLICPKA